MLPLGRVVRKLGGGSNKGCGVALNAAHGIEEHPSERQVGNAHGLEGGSVGLCTDTPSGHPFSKPLRGHNETKLGRWRDEAQNCGMPAVANFARTLMIDIQAVRNAVIERWSNGQTEGQINRLKTLKRAMFGRADTELLRARLSPIGEIADHRVCEFPSRRHAGRGADDCGGWRPDGTGRGLTPTVRLDQPGRQPVTAYSAHGTPRGICMSGWQVRCHINAGKFATAGHRGNGR
jgi:hypothetical protein